MFVALLFPAKLPLVFLLPLSTSRLHFCRKLPLLCTIFLSLLPVPLHVLLRSSLELKRGPLPDEAEGAAGGGREADEVDGTGGGGMEAADGRGGAGGSVAAVGASGAFRFSGQGTVAPEATAALIRRSNHAVRKTCRSLHQDRIGMSSWRDFLGVRWGGY
ncbi:hypothetical protein B0H10DRAFT_1938168 [Mycena sp. CBHHK59/15]|nr:hypothetical protein B0H10DRAFT_1938168 [Mycena sp. CBHHK59/15]